MTFGVAVVGCGVVGYRRAKVIQSTGVGKVRVVADLDAGRATAVAKDVGCVDSTSWLDAIRRDDVDVVIVATTHNWLAPVAIEAVRRGKHVLVEKPMACTPDEARKILDEVEAQGNARRSTLKVGYNHRYHPAISQARDLLMDGVIGKALYVRCRYGHGGRPGYGDEWRANRQFGGGQLLDQGIHALDLCRWFLGEFSEAFAFTATYFWTPTERRPHVEPVEDNSFGLFRTADGQVASVHTSWTQWKNLFSCEVFGRDGYLIIDGLGRSYGRERLVWGHRRPESGPPDEQHFEFPEGDSSWETEWRDFVDAIHESRAVLADGYDGWQALRMVDALHRSARTAAVATIEKIDRRIN